MLKVLAAAAALTAMTAAAAPPPAEAQPRAVTFTLDGGMFINVGRVLSTSDPGTATVFMNLTWSASGNIATQTARFNAGQSDEGPFLDPQVTGLGGGLRQASFLTYANQSNVATRGGVVGYDSSGEALFDDAYSFQNGYTEAQSLTHNNKWARASCACWMNGDTLKGTKGASLSFTMGGNEYCGGQTPGDIGASVGLVGDWASARGTAKVLIDGKKAGTISEKKPAKTNRVVVWQKRYKGFTQATHKIRVVVTSGRFDVDGLEWEYAWDYRGCGGG